MGRTVYSLIRASVIFLGSLALSLLFKALHPVVSILMVFSLFQIAEDCVRNGKEIAKMKKEYGGDLKRFMVSFHKKRLVIDILTTIGWFIIAVGAFLISIRFFG